VARGSVVVVAAVSPMFNIPASGIVLILAIDQILDMGRTATNVIGNGIATAVIAKWEERIEARERLTQGDPGQEIKTVPSNYRLNDMAECIADGRR